MVAKRDGGVPREEYAVPVLNVKRSVVQKVGACFSVNRSRSLLRSVMA